MTVTILPESLKAEALGVVVEELDLVPRIVEQVPIPVDVVHHLVSIPHWIESHCFAHPVTGFFERGAVHVHVPSLKVLTLPTGSSAPLVGCQVRLVSKGAVCP
jgi:hypothetical protein